MFSVISLYFSYRRETLLAERYVAGLTETPAATAAQVTAEAPEQPLAEHIKLAA